MILNGGREEILYRKELMSFTDCNKGLNGIYSMWNKCNFRPLLFNHFQLWVKTGLTGPGKFYVSSEISGYTDCNGPLNGLLNALYWVFLTHFLYIFKGKTDGFSFISLVGLNISNNFSNNISLYLFHNNFSL